MKCNSQHEFTKEKSQSVHRLLQLTEHKAKRQIEWTKQKCPASDISILLLLKLINKWINTL